MKPLTPLLVLLPLTLASSPSPGCTLPLPSTLTPGSSTYNITLSSASVRGTTTQRQYIVHLPSSYSAANNAPAPLVLAFHGQSLPARSMERISGFSDPAFNEGSVVVFPEGVAGEEFGVQWLSDPAAPNSNTIDDRIFVSEVLDAVTAELCIDESRVYAAGLSNGGGLTGLLMCDAQLNKRFAAFATVSGAFYPDSSLSEPLFGAGCRPELQGRKLPYMNLHGLNDSVVDYKGVATAPVPSVDVRAWVEEWAGRDACVDAPVVRDVEGGTVTESSWTCGGEQDVVVHRAIEGFGHGWPSVKNQGEPFETLRGGPTSWDATPLILEWFAKWTL